MTATTDLTKNQVTLLENTVLSPYCGEWNPIGVAVWTWSTLEDFPKASHGGIIAKAQEAGLIDSFVEADPEENCVAITAKGWDAILAEYGLKVTGDDRADLEAFEAAWKARNELPEVVEADEPVPAPKAVKKAPVAPGPVEEKCCPKCGTAGPVDVLFGYRNTKRTKKDGTVVHTRRVQSYCRPCRSSKLKK